MPDAIALGDTGVEESTQTTEDLEKVFEKPKEETPVPDTEDENDEAEPLAAEGDKPSEEEGQEEEPEENHEFNFAGHKLSVPKSSIPDNVRDEIDKFTKGTMASYTQKAQAIAEQTKSLEAREGTLQKMIGMQGEALDTYSKGLSLKSELEQLRQVNLNELWQSDPDKAREYSDVMSQKTAQLNSIISEVGQQEQALGQEHQQEIQRREMEGRKIVERRIKGFESKADDVVAYAMKTYGVPKVQAQMWGSNPVAAETMYKSMLFDKMQEQTKKKAKPIVPDAKPVTPMKTVGGKQTMPLNGKISAEDYRKRFAAKQKRG